jgi:uncharacterized protein (DUF362 family)
MTTPSGRYVDVNSLTSIRSTVSALIDGLDLPTGPEPIVLPELSYPFHPSTGLVTNPDVAAAVVDSLQSSLDTDVGLAYTDSKHADGEQTASFVGYDAITGDARVDVVDLEGADAVEQTVQLDDGQRTVSVPTPLLDRPVVVVPTLRYGNDHPIVGGTVTAARATRISAGVPRTAGAAALVIDPAGVILDATYTYTGQPDETGVLIAGDDVVDVDRVAARLAGLDPTDVPSLAAVPGSPSEPLRVPSLSIESIRDRLPNQPPPQMDTPGPMVQRGYRLYTQLTGDAYPPQFDT